MQGIKERVFLIMGPRRTHNGCFGRENISYSVISQERMSEAPKPWTHKKQGTNHSMTIFGACLKTRRIRIGRRSALLPEHLLVRDLETASHVDSIPAPSMGNLFLKSPFSRESHFYQGSANPLTEGLVTKTLSCYLPSIHIRGANPQGLWSLINWYFALKSKEGRDQNSLLCQMWSETY